MKIKLESGYTLNGDGYNYWLSKVIEPENGGKKYDRRCSGYYKNIEDVFMSALDRQMAVADVENFQQLSKHIDKVRRDIKKAVKGLKAHESFISKDSE